MKAVIMAGGEGSRLRPVTSTCPKPMARVLDKPVMYYTLELLRKHGVKDAAVTLMYMPKVIEDYFGDGGQYGVNLSYFIETAPLGTAGSVKQAAGMLDETFVVLSGDGVTDCDLTSALEFHRRKGAKATMVLKKVPTPIEYGVVLTGQDDRVKRFIEKPGWGEACSDAVNTGIYIMEPEILGKIPANRPYDFGRDLFPALVGEGERVYGYLMDGYWCDVGDIQAYLKANFDLLDGKMSVPGVRAGYVNRMPGSYIDKSAILEAPCLIAPNARIEAGARIGAYSVVGAGSVVGRDSSVKRSVIWPGAVIGERNSLRGTVLLRGASTKDDASLFEESVVGDSSVVGEGATVMSGVKIWPCKSIEDGERVDLNVVWGRGVTRGFVNGVFEPRTPADAVKDAQGFAGALNLKRVAIANDKSLIASAYKNAVVAGLMAQGVQVVDSGAQALCVMRLAIKWAMADGGLYVARDGILALDRFGAGLQGDLCRKVRSGLEREDYQAPFSGVTRAPKRFDGCEMGYLSGIADACAQSDFTNAKVCVFCQNELVLTLAETAMRQMGMCVRAEWEEEMMAVGPGEIGVWLDDLGQRADFADENGMLTEAERTLLLCWTALESGESEVILPRGATRVAEELAARYEADVRLTPCADNAFQRALALSDSMQFQLHFDGIASAIFVIARLLDAKTTPREVLATLSKRYRRTRVISVDRRDKGRLMRGLCEAIPEAELSDGVIIDRGEGWAFINPRGDRRECLVTVEAATAEFAKELCDFCASNIEKMSCKEKT